MRELATSQRWLLSRALPSKPKILPGLLAQILLSESSIYLYFFIANCWSEVAFLNPLGYISFHYVTGSFGKAYLQDMQDRQLFHDQKPKKCRGKARPKEVLRYL